MSRMIMRMTVIMTMMFFFLLLLLVVMVMITGIVNKANKKNTNKNHIES